MTSMPSELSWARSIGRAVALVILSIALASCGGSSGGGSSPAPAPPAGSVIITGTVSGTVIKVLRADTNAVISQTDTASQAGPPPFPFTLSNIPVGVAVKVYFFSAGQVFPLYIGNTNVFTVLTTGPPIDLAFVTMGGGRATPDNQPSANTIQPGTEDSSLPPQNIIPPAASISVTIPNNGGQVQGPDVTIKFALQNFTIGNQNQAHLHVYLDGDQTFYEFLNGFPSGQVLHNGNSATNAQWVTGTEIRFLALSTNTTHTVQFKLATASHTEFVAPGTATVDFFIQSPPPTPATINVTSPADNQTLLFGPVPVEFNVTNFAIQGQGQPQLHFYVDGNTSNLYQFLNGSNQVLLNGVFVANAWVSSSSFQLDSLTAGQHSLRLVLANGDTANTELSNSQATNIVNFIVEPPLGSTPTLTITSPAQGESLSPGPVPVIFDIRNSPVPLSATQPRMHFYVDNGTTVYKFYDGPGITEDGSMSGVRYNGFHTHFVHWKSGSSIQLNSLASGPHRVRFVLVDQSETELTSTQKTLDFDILAGATGEFSLQLLVQGDLSFPAAMATTPDGRIFVNELATGRIRVVTPKVSPIPWVLQDAPFATLPVETGNEKGLLGIAVDPNFSVNGFVYVFYTGTGPVNRVVRFTATISNGDTVATSATPIVIFDNIPAGENHNSGIIHFGPDGMLYIAVGENEIDPSAAQDLSSLKGKILRIRPNGTIPSDNPFFNSLPAPYSAIYSYGHRNFFGFSFHPHTGDFWQTENGPNDNDEINRIIAGGNYGWPIVSGIGNDPQYISPILTFTPTIAPTGIVTIREDSVYPAAYHNNLLFADFNFGKLHRIVLGGPGLTDLVSYSIACDCGWGGLLAVMQGLNVPGQDGYIYVTNGAGIFRVVFNGP